MSKTKNKFSPEVRDRAVWLVLNNEGQHGSWWQVVIVNDWVKKAERMKALKRENRALRQANEILCKASA